MRFKKTAALLGVTALVALAGPAMAATPSLVTVNGSSAATDYPYTGASKGSIGFSSGSVTMGCTSATAAGVIHGGPVGAAGIASIASTTWSGCTGPLGISMTVSMKPLGSPTPWKVVGVSGATTGTADTIVGRIDNVVATVKSTNPLVSCSFTVVGSANGTFVENVLKSAGPPAVYGQDLVINESAGNLTLDNVVGCFGQLNDGDPANFSGRFNVNVTGLPGTPINVS